MTATFFKIPMECSNCSAEWTCLGVPEDPLSWFCPECASQWVSAASGLSEWRPADTCVGSSDALSRAVQLIRSVFGPGVIELDALEV
jgi:hypothetical protein